MAAATAWSFPTAGTVANADGYIGGSILSSNNNALVSGTNSLWTNSGILYVGLFGGGNTLTIASEGSVAAASISLGASNGSSGTLNIGSLGGSDAGGTITAGSIDGGLGTGTINFNQTNNVTVTSMITGTNLSLNHLGTGTVTLSGASYSGGTLVSVGALAGSSSGLQGNITNNGIVIFDQGTNGSYAGMLSGSGAVSKAGGGTVTFTTENTYSGGTVINYGTLTLNASSGKAAKNTVSVTVATNATLLISASEQVNNSAAVTLSGGTIARGGGVSETFGTLNLTANSFLNYGSFSESNFIQFGSLSMGGFTLGVTGFANQNQLAYSASSLIDGASKLSSFTFDNSYTTSFSSGAFTITAIPEASTSAAGLALLAFGAWVFISTTPRFFLPLKLRRWKGDLHSLVWKATRLAASSALAASGRMPMRR